MGYRIQYGEKGPHEQRAAAAKGFPLWLGAALCLGVAIAGLVWTDRLEMIRGLFFPLTDEFVIATFQNMLARLGSGAGLGEAVAAFCREVIAGAQVLG